MKPICGIKTIKGAIALGFPIGVVIFLIRLLNVIGSAQYTDTSWADLALRGVASIVGSVFLLISFWILRKCLVWTYNMLLITSPVGLFVFIWMFR